MKHHLRLLLAAATLTAIVLPITALAEAELSGTDPTPVKDIENDTMSAPMEAQYVDLTAKAPAPARAAAQDTTIRFTVPAGATMTVALATDLDSDTTVPGDQIETVLKTPLMSPAGFVVLPEGTRLVAKVQEVSHAKMAHVEAKMLLDFYKAVTPDGVAVPVSATVDSEDGYLVGNRHKAHLGTMAVSTAAKEAVALTAGPVAGVGTGVLFVVAGKGSDVALKPGDEIFLKLSKSVYFDPSQMYHQLAMPKEAATASGYNFLNIAPEEVPLQEPHTIPLPDKS